MYCSSCGSLINEGQSFCANCGAPVAPAVVQGTPVVQAQPVAQPVVQPQPVVQAQPVAQPVVQPQPVVQAQPVAQQVVQQQPVSQPLPAAQPVSPAPVKKAKSFSIAGFIIGLETLAFSWIIFVNALSVVTGLIGAVFSIIALVRKKCGLKVLAVIGLIANVVGLVLSVLLWATMWSNDVYEFMEPFFRWFYH
ncbi:MAG: zinc ribbon domain-containing protein [Clostridiales bacterium]|nr:zinc ribbon domain-containing protein [Clostridiales bacterium]